MEKYIPKIVYGTAWKKERTSSLVEHAIKNGFRGIDTACQPKHYNEAGAGEGIRNSKVAREDLFLQTKFTSINGQDASSIPYDPTKPLEVQIERSLEVSLKNLGTDYLDSLVLHSPMNTMKETLQAWAVFESFVELKKVRQLGISNCYSPDYFFELFNNKNVKIKPTVLQNRFYAQTGYDQELRKFCLEQGIIYQSFWTLSANPHILKSKIIMRIATSNSVSSAVVFYRCLSERGIVPLCGTTSTEHMREDLKFLEFQISKEEVDEVFKILES